MYNLDKAILLFLYSITLVITIVFLLNSIKKNGKLRIVDFFNIYYVIVYYCVPLFSIFNNSPIFKLKYSSYFSYSFKYHIYSYIYAILFFIILNLSYNLFNRKKCGKINEVNIKSNMFFLLNIMYSIIGIFAYYMWSKIYGFPFGILKYADALRDNRIIINNPYTIFQPFCNFSVFASYMWLLLIKEYKNKFNRLFAFIMFAITFSFAVLSSLATDSRMSIITLFLVPIIFLVNKKRINIKKIAIWGVISIIALGNLDNITYFIRNNEFKANYNNSNNNIAILLSNEFGFTYANRINLLYNIGANNVALTEANDLKNIIYAWVPKSLKPKDTMSLGNYNTTLYSNPSGVIPTDVVSAGLYKGRTVGLLALSIFLGILLKICDLYFAKKKNVFHQMMFYVIGIMITLRLVAYYDLAELLYSRFALIIYFISIILFCKEDKISENN